MANHFPSNRVRSASHAAAPRQRLVWGWHAAVAGCVGVTSAPRPGGLKTRGGLSGEHCQIQSWSHCGNGAALVIWGLSDGEAYLEMLPGSPLEMERKEKSPFSTHPFPPTPNTDSLLFFFTQLLLCLLCPCFLSFTLNEVVAVFSACHKQQPRCSLCLRNLHVTRCVLCFYATQRLSTDPLWPPSNLLPHLNSSFLSPDGNRSV